MGQCWTTSPPGVEPSPSSNCMRLYRVLDKLASSKHKLTSYFFGAPKKILTHQVKIGLRKDSFFSFSNIFPSIFCFAFELKATDADCSTALEFRSRSSTTLKCTSLPYFDFYLFSTHLFCHFYVTRD